MQLCTKRNNEGPAVCVCVCAEGPSWHQAHSETTKNCLNLSSFLRALWRTLCALVRARTHVFVLHFKNACMKEDDDDVSLYTVADASSRNVFGSDGEQLVRRLELSHEIMHCIRKMHTRCAMSHKNVTSNIHSERWELRVQWMYAKTNALSLMHHASPHTVAEMRMCWVNLFAVR